MNSNKNKIAAAASKKPLQIAKKKIITKNIKIILKQFNKTTTKMVNIFSKNIKKTKESKKKNKQNPPSSKILAKK